MLNKIQGGLCIEKKGVKVRERGPLFVLTTYLVSCWPRAMLMSDITKRNNQRKVGLWKLWDTLNGVMLLRTFS